MAATMTRGVVAVLLLRAAVNGSPFPSAVPDTPGNRKVWDDTRRDIANFPPGVIPDVPYDYNEPPASGAVTKGASDPTDPNPVDAAHVVNHMLRNYPAKALGWMDGVRWIGPIDVPTDRVDVGDADGWAASHQPDRVKHFAKQLKKGTPVSAGVSVQEPGESKIKVVDGHHRYLASVKAGVPFHTYIGFVDKDGGPWDETHLYQFHQGADPGNKDATPEVVKVGPKGYIHGWIFVGVPGVGDEVRHPEHGKGKITSHDDKHVTVAFHSGKSHTFEVHRKDGETGHFTKRGDLEHAGPHAPKVEHPADRVFRDPEEAKKLTDEELKSTGDELLARHEKAGIWGDESAKYDDARSAVWREQRARETAGYDAKSLAMHPASAQHMSDEDLGNVRRITERQAAERGIPSDFMAGHRAARVEQARRADPSGAWSIDKLHIFGGTPSQQLKTEAVMKKLTSDIPPEKMASLAHVHITDESMKDGTQGLYYWKEHKLALNPSTFTPKDDAINKDCEASGWYSKSGHANSMTRTLDHELGHHLDSTLSGPERELMFSHLSDIMGTTPLRRSQGPVAFLHASRADEYVAANKADIINSVGTYAATNSYELVAELWTEYHGKKLNGTAPTDQFKTSQVVGRALVGHDTPYNPKEG